MIHLSSLVNALVHFSKHLGMFSSDLDMHKDMFSGTLDMHKDMHPATLNNDTYCCFIYMLSPVAAIG